MGLAIDSYLLLLLPRGRCQPRDGNWRRRMDKDRGNTAKETDRDTDKGKYKDMDLAMDSNILLLLPRGRCRPRDEN